MPELPEVETVRQGLLSVMEGQCFEKVLQRRANLRWPFPEGFVARLEGQRIQHLGRRSKYLLATLSGGEVLIMHLGMSGRILIETPQRMEKQGAFIHRAGENLAKHDHVVFVMSGGARIIFNDARRFGAMDLCPAAELSQHKWLHHLGPEPLGNDFHGDYLYKILRQKRAPMKAVLLDQKIIAGLGNIYVCEALHRAKISPLTPALNILKPQLELLVTAIREVLTTALEAGGSSLKDYRQADGELGYFQHQFQVYDREGAPCSHKNCTGKIIRKVQSGRSSYYCPECSF